MKNTISRILNYLLYLSTCLLIGTGLVLEFRLVPGSKGGKGLSLLGYGRHDWSDVHLWISYLFIVLIIMQLVLHWKWLIKIASQNHSWRLWAGFLFGIVIILFLMLFPIESRFAK